MANDNAVMNKSENEFDDYFDIDELVEKLDNQLMEELSDLEFLEEEKEKIGNPDNLGKVVLDEVYNQFGNQIGLDITNETLIQKYDREHPEDYDEVGKRAMQDKRFRDANNEVKKQHELGALKDEYTGKDIKITDNPNLDHVVARKELYENQRRKQANLSVEELANKKENLKVTNEALNKSKGAKSVDKFINTRSQREKDLIEQNERANKKIDESNMSDVDKRLNKENNNKRLQDKLDAKDELMKKADKEAREAINKDIAKGAVKEVGKKVGLDALKMMATEGLFTMSKEIIAALVRFFKSKSKSFQIFLEEMKNAIKSFFKKITNILHKGASSIIGTILSEIFSPIVSMFNKLASLIKQGVSSVIKAVKYLKDKNNKNKPFSIKVAQVGKIITAGLVAIGAISLGQGFETILLKVPFMQITLPLIGTLANLVGMFLASLVSGIIGAIVINLIDKFIAKRQREEAVVAQINKSNEVIATQNKVRIVNEIKLEYTKNEVGNNITQRHAEAGAIMAESFNNILKNNNDIKKTSDEIERLFDEL